MVGWGGLMIHTRTGGITTRVTAITAPASLTPARPGTTAPIPPVITPQVTQCNTGWQTVPGADTHASAFARPSSWERARARFTLTASTGASVESPPIAYSWRPRPRRVYCNKSRCIPWANGVIFSSSALAADRSTGPAARAELQTAAKWRGAIATDHSDLPPCWLAQVDQFEIGGSGAKNSDCDRLLRAVLDAPIDSVLCCQVHGG